MKNVRRLLLISIALVCMTGAMEVSTQTSVVKVLECLRANAPRQLLVSDLRIEARGNGVSTRTLSAKFYSRRDDSGLRAMLHVTAPSDLAGLRYLLVEQQPEDALYLYLPALGKVRRVSGTGPEAEIAGTTLNYADLRLISQALSAASITLEAPTTFMTRVADVLRFVPAIADSPYRRVLATVDRETCVTLRAEFQNGVRTVKEYRVDPASLMRNGRSSYASRATLEDTARGSSVQISMGGVNAAPKLASRLFDPRNFYRVD